MLFPLFAQLDYIHTENQADRKSDRDIWWESTTVATECYGNIRLILYWRSICKQLIVLAPKSWFW